MFFKNKTSRDKDYLAWIRTHSCQICGLKDETIASAHMGTGGKGIKASDYETLPLCYEHHMEEHAGRESFAGKYNIDIWREIAGFNGRYIVKLKNNG